MARLMSITGRPPNGARRFASSKGIVRSLKGANAPITTPVLRPGAATAVNQGANTPVSGAMGDGLAGALTAPLTLSMINKAVGFFQYAQ
jgi:NAD(P)H-hydrate repair Nnr-like enzyme with NAD(P)H-hydrate dehydratase domain